MTGQSGLLIVAVLGMTVADVGFDLLNLLVFHGNYYAAMVIAMGYYLSKNASLSFRSNISLEKEPGAAGWRSADSVQYGVLCGAGVYPEQDPFDYGRQQGVAAYSYRAVY